MRCDIYSFAGGKLFGINTAGYSDDVNETRFGPGRRNNYIIHYVLSGRGYFNGNTVKAGQGFLITPHLLEHYYADAEDPWSYIWIIFEEKFDAREIFKEYDADRETNIFEYNNLAVLKQAKNDIIEKKNKFVRPSELYEAFLHIFNNHRIDRESLSNAEDMYFACATKFIGANLFRRITVDEIVRVLGISQPYLYRIVKKKASVSPKQYIDIMKTEKAKEMLRQSMMSMTQIANSVGLEDCIAFSKFFKKRVGISPSEFRKNERKDLECFQK